MKNSPTTIEASVLDTVAGGWRRHGHHHRGGFRNNVVVNNYWGQQAAPVASNSFSMSMRSGCRF